MPRMDVRYINPFLSAAVNVLKTMAMTEAKPGKPYIKKDGTATGDITGIIGITGDKEGSLSITFTEPCILHILSNMLGESYDGITEEVKDAVGELTNMICGNARQILQKEGLNLSASIPTIVTGKGHTIKHLCSGPKLAIPFSTEAGDFTVEVCLSD
ncbi:chemotaxis protein CheX [Thermosulfuriphilus sp.]